MIDSNVNYILIILSAYNWLQAVTISANVGVGNVDEDDETLPSLLMQRSSGEGDVVRKLMLLLFVVGYL